MVVDMQGLFLGSMTTATDGDLDLDDGKDGVPLRTWLFSERGWSTYEEKLAKHLNEVRARLDAGGTVRATVRQLLSWYGSQRRGYWIVKAIRDGLASVSLATEPDFESVWIDATVQFVPVSAESSAEVAGPIASADAEVERVEQQAEPSDPAYRIRKLPAANRRPTSVAPMAPLEEVATIMMVNDFSQVPVMTGDRDVKGVVSWTSIGRRFVLEGETKAAKDVMDRAMDIGADRSIFEAIPVLAEHGYVLVRDRDRTVLGIVTASDLNDQFRQLAEPFLTLGEIENHIRAWIDDRFSAEELADVLPEGDERQVASVSDLTFGEYVRLLEKPASWDRLELPLDRATVVKSLDNVRRIRNDVMHFDPDGIAEEDILALREFAAFLRTLTEVRP